MAPLKDEIFSCRSAPVAGGAQDDLLPSQNQPGSFEFGFCDDPQRKSVYLAVDSVRKFHLMKIPFSEIL